MKRDYYEVLEVSKEADARTIKRAFLKKARELHPDVSSDPDAEEKFKEVNEAYSVLSDEHRRQNYDQFGDPDGPQGFGGSGYVDMSDIFGGFGVDDIFSSFFGGGQGSSSARQARTRGRDMGITLRITLEEAASGCTKTVAYDRLAPCDDCGGSGIAEGGSTKTCARCHGTGRVTTVQRTILGQMQTQSTCPDCNGSGTIVDHPCEMCEGQGRVPTHETVQIDIPAGIHSGHQLKVSDKGEAGIRGERGGDLLVRIEVADDERFQRQGDDLICLRSISAVQAMLGCVVYVDGVLEGEVVRVVVPEGCQNGQQVRVEGHGMPRLGMSARGKLVVVIGVSVPTDLTEEERELVSEVARLRGESFGDDDCEGTASSDPVDKGKAEGRSTAPRPRKHGRQRGTRR